MSALTSLLVRDRVVPVSKIEEALHSQVFQGGDIEIILLEMGLVAEDVLSAYRAALFDLLPATREEVMKAREPERRVPAEMARSLGIVPIFFEGRSLVVAAWEPLYEPRLREVEAQLGCELSVRIVNQARLASALAHHYGFELEPRLRKLSDALRRRDPGVVPYVRPPSDSMRPIVRAGGRRPTYDSDLDSELDNEPDTVKVPLPTSLAAPAPSPMSAPSSMAEQASLGAAVEAQLAASPSDRSTAASSRASTSANTEDGAELTAVELGESSEEDNQVPIGVSRQLASLVRGAIDFDRAVELLQVASQRDDVLFVLLRYAQQYFDFVCIFSAGKEGVRARMAHGAGLPRDLVEQVFVPAPRAGLMADVIRSRRPQLGLFGNALDEKHAASLLNREPGRLGLAIPIELNQRVVLLVYADRVGSGLELEHASLVNAVVPAVLDALRRIIIEQKTQRRAEPASPSGPPPKSAPPPLPDFARTPESALRPPPPAPPVQRAPQVGQPSRPTPAPIQATPPAGRTPLVAPPAAVSSARPGSSADDDFQLGPAARAQQDALASVSLEELVNGSSPLQPAPASAELSAVDLDAFERMIRDESPLDLRTRPIIAAPPVDPRDGAMVRDRIAGIPRSAPPPPSYEPAAPTQAGNAYRHRSGVRHAPERVRLEHSAAASAAAQPQARGPAAASDVAVETAPAGAQIDRIRLSLVEPAVDEPSVIIDMGESVDALVEALMHAPPGTEPREIDELLQIGESALPVLMQHFPGPLWYDRARSARRRPRGRDVSAVARAVTAFGERAAPYLASLLADGDAERSYYALLVAGEIVHADLIDPVARRVLDRDESLRALALEVLRSYAVLPQYDVVVRAISDLTERPGKDPRRQRLAVEALGALRDARALRTLLVRLSDRDESVVRAAHTALVVLTGQDFGFAARKWETWVEGWGRAHRVEWLIESLLHNDEGVRTLAGEELKLLTQQYFGYHPALSRREREVAQRKYREWWELEGRLSFGR